MKTSTPAPLRVARIAWNSVASAPPVLWVASVTVALPSALKITPSFPHTLRLLASRLAHEFPVGDASAAPLRKKTG